MKTTAFCLLAILGLTHLAAPATQNAVQTGDRGRCAPDWAASELAAMGMISVTDPLLPTGGATPDDASDDDTQAIQEAIFRAMEACVNDSIDPYNRLDVSGCKSVYFPPGTYHVSDTIYVIHPLQPVNGFLNLYLNSSRQVMYDGTDDGTDNGTTQPPHRGEDSSGRTMRRRSNVLLGSTCGPNRPTIKLQNASAGFGDASSPKPLIHYFAQCRDAYSWACGGPIVPGSTLPEHSQSTIGFHDIFRGIDIDVSGAFPGAIGLKHAGAQGAAIEDTTINASGAYAGIEGIPGQGGGAYNIRVSGARHGVITGPFTAYGLLVGATLIDQSERAINHENSNNPLVVVGFNIRKSASSGGAPVYSHTGWMNSIVMVSGVVEANNTPAIATGSTQAVYLRDVYVQGTSAEIVATPLPLNRTYTNDHVIEWSYTPTLINQDSPQTLDNGLVYDGQRILANVVANAPPPSDVYGALVAPHIWSEDDLPSFEDSDSIIVLPGGDIQAALDSSPNARVFLAGGRHTISATVKLGANDKLSGLDRAHTVLKTDDAWAQTVAQGTPIVHASADASSGEDEQSEKDGLAALGRLSLRESAAYPFFTHTLWEVGRHSTLHGVIFGPDEAADTGSIYVSSEDHGLRWGTNGGGRAWGFQPEGAFVESSTYHPDYRQFFSDGSSQPINIYGMNCEKAHSDYTCEFRNASNINVYMLKSETCHQCNDWNRPDVVGGVFTAGDDGLPGASGPADRQPILKISRASGVNIFGAGGNAAPTSGSAAVIDFTDDVGGEYSVAVYGPNANTKDVSLVYERWSGSRVGNAAPGDSNARMLGHLRRTASICSDSCGTLGAQCGTLCGIVCGVCGQGQSCDANLQCVADSQPVEIVVDNNDANTSANPGNWWQTLASTTWNFNSVSHHWGTFRWTPELPREGIYSAYAWWNYKANFSTSVPYRIAHLDGLETVLVSQRDPSSAGRWTLLGTFRFEQGNVGYVEVSAENGQANADAVAFVLQHDADMPPDGDDPPAPNAPPIARIIATPAHGTHPLTVLFDGSTSSDPDGSISTHHWNFGDGETATGLTATHTFTDSGVFHVMLTVTDDVAASASQTTTIEVLAAPENQPPHAEFVSNTSSGTAPLTVNFDATASNDPDGTITSYQWDFGEGTTDAGITTTHTYAEVGVFEVTLTVTDDAGTAAADTSFVQVLSEQTPTVDIVVDNTDAGASMTPDNWWLTTDSTTWNSNSVSHHWGTFRWSPDLPQSGIFSVYAWWNFKTYLSTTVPYRIAHTGGIATVLVNQRDPSTAGQWILLGTFQFGAGNGGYVEVSAENGQANADAVRFVLH